MTTDSRELNDLIALRNETPVLVAVQDVSHDAAELWRFESDNTEVIVTNSGVVNEDVDGFAETRALILG